LKVEAVIRAATGMFDRKEFRKHLEPSGPPSENAVVDKEYKYTVEIDGSPR
jgi:hypothetical protein